MHSKHAHEAVPDGSVLHKHSLVITTVRVARMTAATMAVAVATLMWMIDLSMFDA